MRLKCLINLYKLIQKNHWVTIIKVKIYFYFDIGVVLFDLKRYEDALRMYEMAIKNNPEFSDAYHNKG